MRTTTWLGGVLAAFLVGVAPAMSLPQEPAPEPATPLGVPAEQSQVDLNRLAEKLRFARHRARSVATPPQDPEDRLHTGLAENLRFARHRARSVSTTPQDPKDRMRKALRTLSNPEASHDARQQAARVVKQAQAEQADRMASLEARNRDLKARLDKVEKALSAHDVHRRHATLGLLGAKQHEGVAHQEYLNLLGLLGATKAQPSAKDHEAHGAEAHGTEAHDHLLRALSLAAHGEHAAKVNQNRAHDHVLEALVAQQHVANSQSQEVAKALLDPEAVRAKELATAMAELGRIAKVNSHQLHTQGGALADLLGHAAIAAPKEEAAAEAVEEHHPMSSHDVQVELHGLLQQMQQELAELKARVEKLERSRRVVRSASNKAGRVGQGR